MGEDDKVVLKRIAKIWQDMQRADQAKDQKEWSACFILLRDELNRLAIVDE